jgi:hypothetical protein
MTDDGEKLSPERLELRARPRPIRCLNKRALMIGCAIVARTGRIIMNRRTTLVLTGMVLLGLTAATLPDLGFAQSSPLIGTWKLNLDKSKFGPGAALRSATGNFQQDGQNIRATFQAIDAGGNPATVVFMHIYDGQPHPTTGSRDYDASAYTPVDANTEIVARFKNGKLVAVGSNVVSPDGKALTVTQTMVGSATTILVLDKQ